MFPITYRHQFNYAVQGDERWIAGMLRMHVATALKKKGAQKVTIEGQRILFEGRLFDITYWGLLFDRVSKGAVTVSCRNNQLNMTFEISFVGVFLVVLFMSGFFVVLSAPFGFILAAFLLAFGGSVLLNYVLVYSFLEGQIIEFFNSVAELGIQGQQITSR
jgi:hypothetical protein